MKTNNTTLPLWKALNEKRTQGNWKAKTIDDEWEEIQTDTFNLAGNTIMAINHENKDGKANAQYTALAVNNFADLVKALEGAINYMTLDTPQAVEAHKKIVSALSRIS